MITAVRDLDRTDGNISIQITTLSEDLVKNAGAVLTAEEVKISKEKKAVERREFFDRVAETLTAIYLKFKQQS